jgi:acyl-CoA thioesterase FadM
VRLSLQPTLDPSDYRYTHSLRTRFAETDAMGIIHHGVRSGDAEIDFAVLELYVRHRKPLRFGDEVRIHVVVDGLTRTTFQVGYLLEATGEARATAVTVHGAVDPSGRPSRMPAFLADLVGNGVG